MFNPKVAAFVKVLSGFLEELAPQPHLPLSTIRVERFEQKQTGLMNDDEANYITTMIGKDENGLPVTVREERKEMPVRAAGARGQGQGQGWEGRVTQYRTSLVWDDIGSSSMTFLHTEVTPADPDIHLPDNAQQSRELSSKKVGTVVSATANHADKLRAKVEMAEDPSTGKKHYTIYSM